MGTAVAQWLRCCAPNWKVAGSIPAGVNGFFIDIKSFRSQYGPWVDSASNRNEYREYFLEVKSGRCVRLTTYHHPVPLSRNLGALTSWNRLGLSRPVTWLLYFYLFKDLYTWSVRKVSDLWPGKRNWLTWSVGHLITLKVVPLGLHTLLPAVPPLLEACRKSLFRNGV